MARKAKVYLTKELAEDICFRLSNGESLKRICKRDDMPDRASVLRWLTQVDKSDLHKLFFDMYNRARLIQADILIDEVIDISDDGSNDYYRSEKTGKPTLKFNKENVQRSRLRVETRFQYAKHVSPVKYMDKSRLEMTGKDGKQLESKATVQVYLPDNKRGPKEEVKQVEEKKKRKFPPPPPLPPPPSKRIINEDVKLSDFTDCDFFK